MLLSVVINTYNRPRALEACLAALARQEGGGAFEVVVVDDGGTENLSTIEQPWNTPGYDIHNGDARGIALDLRLVRAPHGGRSAARNRGVAEARGERILFLGDDALPEPRCLAHHREQTGEHVAVVGAYPWLGLRGSPPFCRWAEPNPQNDIADAQNAGFIHFSTGNLSMSRKVFLDLGGFDERFRVYGWEDIDLGLRFERSGGRLVFDPRALAVHDHPPMRHAELWRREFEMGQTAWQFWEKWSGTARGTVEFMNFWGDPATLRPGPAWRRALGRGAIALLDRLAPGSGLNARLYERMIYAQRLAGVVEAWRRKQPMS